MIFDSKKYIASKVKEYRKKRRLTQAELAEKVDLATKQISRIEIAEFYPSLPTFFKIFAALNMDINDFINTNIPHENKLRERLIERIYAANDEELSFYDRILAFALDEVQEVKKNIALRRITF